MTATSLSRATTLAGRLVELPESSLSITAAAPESLANTGSSQEATVIAAVVAASMAVLGVSLLVALRLRRRSPRHI